MARTRTDVHSPKNLVTEDYEFFGCGNYGTAEVEPFSPLISEHGKQLLADGWRFGGEGGGNCDHCGAFIIYYAILKHIPSHTLIKVGETCLDNRFSLATSEFQSLRKSAKLNRERVRLSAKREEWLASNPDNGEALEWAGSERERGTWKCSEHGWDCDGYGSMYYYGDCKSYNEIFVSVVQKKGEASEKFVASVLRDKARTIERDARKAEERSKGAPVVEGKGTIEGEIVKLDTKLNDFGTREVMTVKDDRGFKVWGTQPPALYDCEIGDRVRFVATVSKSDRDEQFGFFKRPSKAERI